MAELISYPNLKFVVLQRENEELELVYNNKSGLVVTDCPFQCKTIQSTVRDLIQEGYDILSKGDWLYESKR